MTPPRADVLILGGGPAGGMTALLLARAGKSVVLCETHERLPDRVCGMYLCPAGVALLERQGLHDAVAAGARRLEGMIMVAPDLRRLETHFPQGDGLPDHGVALPRPKLDNTLLDLARGAGATVRLGARPVALDRVPGGWSATLAGGEKIEARLLIGADGRKSFTARRLGLALPVRRSRVAVHIDRPTLQFAPPFGQMHVFDDGSYMGINALAPETMNLSLVCDPDTLKARGAVRLINERIAGSPHLSAYVEPLPETARPGATFPTSARVRQAATDDAALVGDASGYGDPLTGEGIYGALWTAEALAECLLKDWENFLSALHAYAARRARAQRAKSILNEVFQFAIHRPWLANSILHLLSRRQAVADSFIGIVGNSYSPAQGFARIAHHTFAF